MLERLSYESTPMNELNTRLIMLAEKYGGFAVDDANNGVFDEAHDSANFFNYLLKELCKTNALDYIVIEFDSNDHPHIKLDNDFAEFENYYYFFVPPFSGWAEETLFSERRKKIWNYFPEFHYPLTCIARYNKVED